MQILFEQWWVDPDHITYYTVNGKKDQHEREDQDIFRSIKDQSGCHFLIQSIMQLQKDL